MRPFRFGFTGGVSSKRTKLLESAYRRGARLLHLGLADHFVRPLAPLIAGQAVADATTTLRVTQTVLAQDFRQPAVLAKELATLDVLSGAASRWASVPGGCAREYEDAGMRFDPAPVRIARLEETAIILKGIFAGGPFTFSGDHYTVTALEGRPRRSRSPTADHDRRRRAESPRGRRSTSRHRPAHAEQPRRSDVARPVAVLGACDRGQDRLDPRGRGQPIRRDRTSAQLIECAVTERPTEYLADLADRIAGVVERMGGGRIDLGEEDLRRSPIVAVGSLDDVCETLVETALGTASATSPLIDAPPDVLAPVIERLAGE